MVTNSVRILLGDCRERLATLPDASVNCVITSPPYYGLRDYKTVPGVWGGHHRCEHKWGTVSPVGTFCAKCGAWHGSYGLEPSLELYVEHTVEIFREVRRVLRADGTLWLNLGDGYITQPPGNKGKRSAKDIDGSYHRRGQRQLGHGEDMGAIYAKANGTGLKNKDLMGMPWRVALALQADGWYLRQDIIWHKPNPLPESIGDRCIKSHEYLFLLSQSPRYHFDQQAIAEPTRNKRSVWTISAESFPGSHFAVFPPDLVMPALLAGCPPDGTVLDPFAGAGTVGLVATWFKRSAILIELSPKYVEMAWERITQDLGLQLYQCPVIIDGPVASTKRQRYRGKHDQPAAA